MYKHIGGIDQCANVLVKPYKRLDLGHRQDSGKPIASLFDPNFERAACGVGFIVNLEGKASRKVSYGIYSILLSFRQTFPTITTTSNNNRLKSYSKMHIT